MACQMKTLGIDLASESKRTAVSAIAWTTGAALVGEPQIGAADENLIPLMEVADWVKPGPHCFTETVIYPR